MGEKDPRPIVGYGYAAGGSFCSLRCGFLFGEKMVEFGHRVSPRDDS
jgi:hypothetical protein